MKENKEWYEWNSCKDGLPKEVKDWYYVVTIELANGKRFSGIAFYHYYDQKWTEYENGPRLNDIYDECRVVAWCRLPEAYKGD